MKIDIEYMKKLLTAFEAAKGAVIYIEELKQNGIEFEDNICRFHFELFVDDDLVKVIGEQYPYVVMDDDTENYCRDVPMRLTSKGHDFLNRLRDKNVWDKVKSDFKYNPISALLDITKILSVKYVEKRIDKLIE